MSVDFDLETFVNEPSLQVVQTLKESHLQELAAHFKLSTTIMARKKELRKLVMGYLVEEELVPEESIEDVPASPVVDKNLLELKCQDHEWERESQLKLCEIELQEKELSVQPKLKELGESFVTPVEHYKVRTLRI